MILFLSIHFFIFQAAEKALKAACYMTDYTKLMSHNLPSIASSLNDQLYDWATSLENMVGFAERMRYPDYRSSGPSSIPHMQYNAEKAEKVKELAAKIVERVRIIIYR